MFDVAGNGIGHGVGQMHTGVAEADAGVRGGEQHAAAGLVIRRILVRARQALGNDAQRFERPYIADGIRPLVG